MWRNYLVTAFRSLQRNKQFSLLNIFGLAVGLAACLLMTSYVIHELSFDRSHVLGDRIFRINGNVPFNGDMLHNAVVAAPLGPAVKETIPEIEAGVRLLRLFDSPIRVEDRDFKERLIFAAEPQFLEVFTIPLRQGNPKTALAEPFTAVIDETLGRKYFGDRDPVGRTLQIRLGQAQEVRVTGVMKDMPSNTVLKQSMILSYATIERVFGDRTTKWEAWGSTTTFVLLRSGADPQAVQKKITAAVLPHLGADEQTTFFDLQPLRRIYLDNAAKGMNNDLDNSGSLTRVAVFSAIALLIMIVAAINFINLSTAKVARRMKEVGVRKTCGAGRGSLIRQFLFESVILTAISMFLGLGFFELFKPRLEAFLGKTLSVGILTTPGMLAVVGAVIVVVGFLAGSYPAFYLSRFPATAMFRPGSGSGSSKSALRRTLVVSQFIIAIALTATTLVVLKQVRFAETKDLGFDRNGLIVLRNETARARKNALLLKDEILRGTPAISAASIAWLPSDQSRSISGFRVEGRAEEKAITAQTLSFDADFVPTMGLRLVAGRNFEAGRTADADGVLINETAVKAFKLKDPVGSRLMRENRFVRVLGVLKDWHTNSIHSEIYPVVVYPSDESAAELVVRLPRDRRENALAEIRAVWARLLPGQTLDLEFVDDVLAQAYKGEQRLAVLLVSFCVLTVFVACLGIFGLASFSAEQRTKEIGVRKVLGASVLGLTVLLSRSFTRWVLLANVVAWPAAYFAARQWLSGFAYRTPMGPGPFLLAGLLALAIAFASVVYQTMKAALADPIQSLHYE